MDHDYCDGVLDFDNYKIYQHFDTRNICYSMLRIKSSITITRSIRIIFEIFDISINIYPLFTMNAYLYFIGFISDKIHTLFGVKIHTQLVVMRAIYYFEQHPVQYKVISETVTIGLLICSDTRLYCQTALVSVGIFLHGFVMLRFRYRYALPKAIGSNDRCSIQRLSKFSLNFK